MPSPPPTDSPRASEIWSCPHPSCRQPLIGTTGALTCSGPERHLFEVIGGYPRFAPEIDVGKYTTQYATTYAFLWSYGYETLQSGLVEGAYRTTTALCADAIAQLDTARPRIVDCGCGVGRVTADLARLAKSGHILALDASPFKLDLAAEILLGSAPVERSLPELGFAQNLRIQGRCLTNVALAQADAFTMPVASASVDLLVSMNLIDRLGHPTDESRSVAHFFAEARRVLRPGGCLVLLSPLNWVLPREWTQHPGSQEVRRALEDAGFCVTLSFDQLLYRETLDARGSVEEFTTAVFTAVAS